MLVKLRYCECGRELDKYCRVCSECRAVNAQISKDIYCVSAEGKISISKYLQSDKCKNANKKAFKKWRDKNIEIEKERNHQWKLDNLEYIKKYNREYYKKRLELLK